MTPTEKQPVTVAAELARMFAGMSTALDERAERLRPAIEKAPKYGPCPTCRTSETLLDRAESENESIRLDRLTLIYDICDHCQHEADVRYRLECYGVPQRVLHATFANYQTAEPGQAEAVSRVRLWTSDPKSVFLILLGSCGTGKGHLAAAAVREMRASTLWTSHCDLLNGYHSVPYGEREKYRARFLRYPVLVIDEMGAKSMTADTPELFYGILDARHDRRLKTILIGNIPLRATGGRPSLLAILGEDRAASRLTHTATIICPNWSDYRLKA